MFRSTSQQGVHITPLQLHPIVDCGTTCPTSSVLEQIWHSKVVTGAGLENTHGIGMNFWKLKKTAKYERSRAGPVPATTGRPPADTANAVVAVSIAMYWASRMILLLSRIDFHAKRETRKPLTIKFLVSLRKIQHNRCHYCQIYMQDYDRRRPNGVTLQRLDNSRGHEPSNSILCCHECNCGGTERKPLDIILTRKFFVWWRFYVYYCGTTSTRAKARVKVYEERQIQLTKYKQLVKNA